MTAAPTLLHPGADPECTTCHGRGIRVVRAGERAVAAACACRAERCPRCKGSTWVPVDPTDLESARVRCACHEVERRQRLFDRASIPARYHHATFETFDAGAGAGPALFQCRAWTRRFDPADASRGFVLYGEVGRGKTHLLIATLRSLVLDHGVRARFVEFSHLLSDLKSSFDRKEGAADVLAPLVDVDVLAIDELGKGRNTAFEGSIVDELVSRRYNAARVLLGTTNFAPEPPTGVEVANNALSAAQRTDPTLGDRLGDRVFSRVYEMSDFIPVMGEDYRVVARKIQRARSR